jgi:transposase-like protein
MTDEIQARLRWVNLYLETENAGLICRRCGISKPTLRLWVGRHKKDGIEGLRSKSKRPAKTPEKKVTPQIEQWVLNLLRNSILLQTY